MKRFSFLGVAAALASMCFASAALADGRELATKNFRELNSIAGTALVSSDQLPVYDASTREVKKVSAASFPGGAYDASSIATSANLTGNPLTQVRNQVLTLAELNAGTNILNSATGKTIFPGNWQVMASGSAAGSGVAFRCRGSNNIIASIPLVMLTDGIPVGPYKSSGAAGVATPELRSAQVRGCPAGEPVYVSTSATMTTTTHFYVSFPYTVQ